MDSDGSVPTTRVERRARRSTEPPQLGAFLIWASAGVIIGLASVSLLFLLPLALLPIGWIILRRTTFGPAWPGSLVGVGAVGLYIAVVQFGNEGGLNPWPWLLGGALLVVAGVLLGRRALRRSAPA